MSSSSALSDYVRMSAVDDLSYPLACDDRTRDAVNTIVSGRKSWKTLKGKGEAVWPPYLEAALVEALDKYRPESSRSTRSLSRFPNRNRFISDYIFHVTGKRRTAKQVGSRLQQLRDTCGGKRILKLLSNRDFSGSDDAAESASAPSPDDSSASDVSTSPPERALRPARALVHIDVLAANAPWPPSPPGSPSCSGGIVLAPIRAAPANVFHSPRARPLRAIDPTVTFTSPAFVDARSACAVYFNGNCVHTDVAELACTPAPADGLFLYRTALVPQFWQRLCESNDPGRYSIVQEIVQAPRDGDAQGEAVLLTVVYQLNEPAAAMPPTPPSDSPSDLDAFPSYMHCDFLQDLSPTSATFSDSTSSGIGDFGHLPPLGMQEAFDPRWVL